ncbi:cystathionine beta-synthase [Chromatiales bacterium (ex Bugula neritina AB1)]|nr:cystathionine beta-synthase [Chromatiales bacterium (ex Bugula neritina AB1)]
MATCFSTVRKILDNLPASWVELTTHRLDIYDEEQAKSQFLQQLEVLADTPDYDVKALEALPTAYDYTRLGHPLSCILEWLVAEINQSSAENVITFSSKTMPILAILRKNALSGGATQLYYDTEVSPLIDTERLENIYGYKFQSNKITDIAQIPEHTDATVIFVTQAPYKTPLGAHSNIDATINIHPHSGSTVVIHNTQITDMAKDLQHVRRRETIAMTPINALNVLQEIVNEKTATIEHCHPQELSKVYDCIKDNAGSTVTPLIASSGLSIQYAMMMGLIEDAMTQHPGKAVNLIIPPNCYGGTNDQARRIARLIAIVDIVDLYVDNGQDLVSSLEVVLKETADSDSVPIILAEIPTNPRVEVPDMDKLAAVLTARRKTRTGAVAIAPVFTIDQTFCPNVKLLDQQSVLAKVKTVSYTSGSKFPSGGRCNSGFCTTNDAAKAAQPLIEAHLNLSDNGATANQLNTMAEYMPSMPERITEAYNNTRAFVDHIQHVLPDARINFITHDLAERGFTPSVFSLDLPSTGTTTDEQEESAKLLNIKLIEHMINRQPDDCKHCVSYGQLKGSYWTIPATSTQGTTKENDKDYIVRVAIAPEIDITKLCATFDEFCQNENLS